MPDLKPFTRGQIFWHFISITLFIVYDILYMSFAGIMPGIKSLALIYTRDVLFFIIVGCYYLPGLWQRNSNTVKRLFIILLIVILYTAVICVLGLIYQSVKLGKLTLELTALNIIAASYRAIYITTIAVAYSFAKYSIAKNKELYEQRILNIKAETKIENTFIRSQVNPHLLYNSLSFIYLKTLEEAPAIAKTVELLVDMTDYALAHEKENDLVALEDDIKQMERYVELQQTLHDNRLHVQLNKMIHIDGNRVSVPPLLFLNFIENIFKYGDLKDAYAPARIEFYLDGKTLMFLAHNKKAACPKSASRGIGLANAEARIKKHFGNQYEIEIADKESSYHIQITIQL